MSEKRLKLVAGSINGWADEDGWRIYVLDVSGRGVWDRDLEMVVQPDFIADIAHLPQFRDETFHEIRLHHVLEHLPPGEAMLALMELHRILKPAGVLDIEVPDVLRVATAFANGELDHAGYSQWTLGEQLENHQPSDSHRSAWTETVLRDALGATRFVVGPREESGLALRFVARKP